MERPRGPVANDDGSGLSRLTVQVPAQALADAQGADGDLWPVLVALAKPESGYNPRAVGDGGCSLGYLQFNQCGGLGAGHPDEELLDGPSNMRLGAQYIRGRLNGGASLWDALQPWSTRSQAWELLQQMQAEGVEGAGQVPQLAGSGGSGGNGAVALVMGAIILFLVTR